MSRRAGNRKLLKLDPESNEYRRLAATIAVGLGEHEAAIAIYHELLARNAAFAGRESLARPCLENDRPVPEAVATYRAAAAARPDFGDAYWSLANLKTYSFTGRGNRAMHREGVARDRISIDRYSSLLCPGKGTRGPGRIRTTLGAYERGNALKRTECQYHSDVIEANTGRQIEVCTRELFLQQTDRLGIAATRPIFIVGLPRSGSTLLEQNPRIPLAAWKALMRSPIYQALFAELQGREPVRSAALSWRPRHSSSPMPSPVWARNI